MLVICDSISMTLSLALALVTDPISNLITHRGFYADISSFYCLRLMGTNNTKFIPAKESKPAVKQPSSIKNSRKYLLGMLEWNRLPHVPTTPSIGTYWTNFKFEKCCGRLLSHYKITNSNSKAHIRNIKSNIVGGIIHASTW